MTSENNACGSVIGGGSVCKRQEPRLDGIPSRGIPSPQCTVEKGARSSGGGKSNTMKDERNTSKHEHGHDKNEKQKNRRDSGS